MESWFARQCNRPADRSPGGNRDSIQRTCVTDLDHSAKLENVGPYLDEGLT